LDAKGAKKASENFSNFYFHVFIQLNTELMSIGGLLSRFFNQKKLQKKTQVLKYGFLTGLKPKKVDKGSGNVF
jgi:hypothetical protein